MYVGPTAPTKYGTADIRIDPKTGEWEITGIREQDGQWPVLPAMYPSWAFMGVFNFISDRTIGKLLKKCFGFEKNPFRLEYHLGIENVVGDTHSGAKAGPMGVPQPGKGGSLPGFSYKGKLGSPLNNYLGAGPDFQPVRAYRGNLENQYRKLMETYI